MTGTFRSNSQGSTHSITIYPDGVASRAIHIVIEGDKAYVTIQEGMLSLGDAKQTLDLAEHKYGPSLVEPD